MKRRPSLRGSWAAATLALGFACSPDSKDSQDSGRDGGKEIDSGRSVIADAASDALRDAAPDIKFWNEADAAPDANDAEFDSSVSGDVGGDADIASDGVTMTDTEIADVEGDADASDVITPDAAPLPILRVSRDEPQNGNPDGLRFVDEFVQVIDDQAGVGAALNGSFNLSPFQLCAEGGPAPVEVDSITLTASGNFYEVPVTFALVESGIEVPNIFSNSNEFAFINDDEAPLLLIPDGECRHVHMKMRLPHNDEYDTWVEPRLISVSSPNAEVIMEDSYSNFGGGVTGYRTVLQPTDELRVETIGNVAERNVARIDRQINADGFRICTEPNAEAQLSEIHFFQDSTPVDTPFAVDTSIYFNDSHFNGFDLPGPPAVIATDGNEIVWRPNRPGGQPFEDLSWGRCLTARFTLPLVRADSETFRINVDTVVADTQNITAVNRDGGWIIEAINYPYLGTLLHFVDANVGAILEVQRFDPYGPASDRYYLYNTEPNPCFNGEVVCPIAQIGARATVQDPRIPALINELSLTIEANQLPEPLDLLITVRSDENQNDRHDPEEETFIIPVDNGPNNAVLPLHQRLTSNDGYSMLITAQWADMPPPDDLDNIAPSVRIDFNSIEATYADQPLPVVRSGPDAPGQGNWSSGREMPDIGPILYYHVPELYVLGTEQGRPIRVDISDYNNNPEGPQPITVSSISLDVPYGAVEICRTDYDHGIGKDHPIAQTVTSSITGRWGLSTLALGNWQLLVAAFFNPDNTCVTVGPSSNSQLEVTMFNPLEATGDPENPDANPINFRLTNMTAHATGNPDLIIPLRKADEAGHLVEVSPADPVSGKVVRFVE